MAEMFSSLTGWLSPFFLNPAIFIPGAALISSPIIIHLLNRLRFRKVRFAAMEFLLQSQKRNKRRILFEQLLLLLMRILAVLLIAALIARFVLSADQLSLLQGPRSHHFVLIDDSLSMRERWEEKTAFGEALKVVQRLAEEGARRPGTQKLSVALLSDPDVPIINGEELNQQFLNKLRDDLSNLKCGHQALNLLEGVEAARRHVLQDRAVFRTLHVVSDYRESDWGREPALAQAIKSFEQHQIGVNLVRAVTQKRPNVSLVGLSGELQTAAVNVPLRLTATIRNSSEQKSDNLRLTVIQDGKPLPVSIPIDAIDPGKIATKSFEVVFATPGRHRVEVSLDPDALPEDNALHLALDLLDANPVLLIHGGEDTAAAETIADALAADPSLTGIAPLIQNPEALRRLRLEQYRCIYMIGVQSLPADAILPLKKYVAEGGGLVWYIGESTNAEFYNAELYEDGGAGIFPVRLGRTGMDLPRATDLNPGPDLVFIEHPLFAIFSGEENPFVAAVHVDRFFPLADDFPRRDAERDDGVKTIATLRNGQPLIFEHRHGEGRVVTCLTSAGGAWNDWPQNPSYVILQLELQKYVSKTFEKLDSELVGTPIAISVSGSLYAEDVEIATPDEQVSRIKMVAKAAEGDDASGDVLYQTTFRETDRPGVYRVTLYDPDNRPQERWLAFNPPRTEGDLTLATDQALLERIGGNVAIQTAENFDWIRQSDAQQEIRYGLIIFLLIVLMIEQFLAYRLSYHTRQAGVAV